MGRNAGFEVDDPLMDSRMYSAIAWAEDFKYDEFTLDEMAKGVNLTRELTKHLIQYMTYRVPIYEYMKNRMCLYGILDSEGNPGTERPSETVIRPVGHTGGRPRK